MHPYVFGNFLIIVSQGRSELKDHVLDALQSFPGIFELFQIILCKGMIQII